MRSLLKDIFYSFPIQLFILHFRKYQLLLIFWFLLVSTVNSGFMHSYGADALFFVPEYLGKVNALSAAIVGIALGVFFMSWNITTFILHTRRFKFLATASKPFLKYCINNAILPLLFLILYLIRSVQFNSTKELLSAGEITGLVIGFLGGFFLLISVSFALFFGADRRILKAITPVISNPESFKANFDPHKDKQSDAFGMKVGYYFSTRLKLRKARNVSHYSETFLDTIFKRHHFSGIVGTIVAFIFLIVCGFFLDIKFFQAPAASCIIIFFAVMVAVIGALTYFLQSWSVLFVIVLLAGLNILYTNEVIDPRNKAYGINYLNTKDRPTYNKLSLQKLCTPDMIAADKANMLAILENWKQKQTTEKPVLVFINVSGGGLRSAAFVMNTLQHIDSSLNGSLMKQTFMISGASGGMLAASYYRELYRNKTNGANIDLYDPAYTDNISQDLLNPVFSSMISRDIFSPVQRFSVGPYRYVKDRGYAFEQKLIENSGGLLGKQMSDYAADEKQAKIPLMIFNAVITRDGRKLMAATQPLSFMMKPSFYATDTSYSPDAVDFAALLKKQDPLSLRISTALRMNATFPYVLPNVWLPTNPVVDAMDAGLRDNYGQETTLRFIDNFKEWIDKNTGGVVIIQIRDRLKDNWQQPFETGSVTDIIVKPATMLQHNWYKLQDYFQADQYSYLADSANAAIHRLTFMYVPDKEDKGAALNFHLTAVEKKDVIRSFNKPYNQQLLKELQNILK
ncbi:hypothetical protein LK994_05375 [Ferruginibacter lapsinanis]|uniref:hypothetical protein n=1 Tax=Ferruginibacter lapsinanis TaxID=563172 RepID=UPI001E363BED|nr:hypothetical protein [Ferruginibacter lapsinanis]UEG50903.1 hypothetical protein LK994_05375 [Ferruginibacter lapsinanis]